VSSWAIFIWLLGMPIKVWPNLSSLIAPMLR
jgi:hypothetical protein